MMISQEESLQLFTSQSHTKGQKDCVDALLYISATELYFEHNSNAFHKGPGWMLMICKTKISLLLFPIYNHFSTERNVPYF